jgi:hypothetical protein
MVACRGSISSFSRAARKSWAYRYRLDGKTRKYTIGAFPKVDLVNARKLARDTPDPYTPHGAITASERAMRRV